MAQKIRNKIVKLTKNITPVRELTPRPKTESIPQTAPGKMIIWGSAKSKLESIRKQREVVLEVAASSVDPNPDEICHTAANTPTPINFVVRRHPENPERFQCVDKRWEQHRARLDEEDHIAIIVGEFSDLEMRALGRYNPLD